MSVLVVGLSHRSAPVAILERAALTGDAQGKLLRDVIHSEHVAGTFNTTGAKLRMLVTPAATSRSQTPWAAVAGVAITPMDTPRSATTSSIASLLPTTCPAAISVPTTVGSASSTAAMRKPREANPP